VGTYNFGAARGISMGRQKQDADCAYLPEARRETRGRAKLMPASAEN